MRWSKDFQGVSFSHELEHDKPQRVLPYSQPCENSTNIKCRYLSNQLNSGTDSKNNTRAQNDRLATEILGEEEPADGTKERTRLEHGHNIG